MIRTRCVSLLALLILGLALVDVAAGAPEAATQRSVSGKIKTLQRQVAALEAQIERLASTPTTPGPQGPQGIAGPQGAAGSDGTSATINGVVAGGELSGTYPSPAIGTVAGLDLANHDGAVGGIHFGPDIDLFRDETTYGITTLRSTGAPFIVDSSFGTTSVAPGFVGLFPDAPESGALALFEATGLDNPAPDSVRLYARDDGADNTELVAVFGNGDTDVITTSAAP